MAAQHTRITVQVTPRSPTDEIVGPYGPGIKVRIKAPPVDSRANEALIKYLARELGLRSADVTVVSGHSSRTKIVEVKGLGMTEIMKKFFPGPG